MKKHTTLKPKYLLIAVIAAFTLATNGYSQNQNDAFFSLTDSLLKTHVDARGFVAYDKIKQKPQLLNSIYDLIETYSLKDKPQAHIKAFYTNAYNILVIKQVIDLYPIDGPLTVDGFFDKIKHKVAGEMLTLNQVEKDKNLYVNKDERLHFVLVCAAKSCPPLANFAFTPEKIESQLNERTKYALNNENFIKSDNKKTEISQIFNWYSGDFKGNGKNGIVSYLNKYRKKQIQNSNKIVYYEYNWELNKQ